MHDTLRSTHPECFGGCMGVDPNRNWEYQWGTGGSSSNCCSDTFKGPSAFSEIEVFVFLSQNHKIDSKYRSLEMMKYFFKLQNVGAYTNSIPNLIFFNDVHSYSQLVLIPWGWTLDPAPGTDDTIPVFQKVVIK